MAKKAKRTSSNRPVKPPVDFDHGPIPVPSGWRRSSKSPDYYEFDDDASKPALTERYELAIIGEKLGALASAAEVAGRPWKESDWVKNAGEHRLSDGTRVSARIAKAMMTIFRPVWKMTRSRGNSPRE